MTDTVGGCARRRPPIRGIKCLLRRDREMGLLSNSLELCFLYFRIKIPNTYKFQIVQQELENLRENDSVIEIAWRRVYQLFE
jgi:hypothetical protein